MVGRHGHFVVRQSMWLQRLYSTKDTIWLWTSGHSEFSCSNCSMERMYCKIVLLQYSVTQIFGLFALDKLIWHDKFDDNIAYCFKHRTIPPLWVLGNLCDPPTPKFSFKATVTPSPEGEFVWWICSLGLITSKMNHGIADKIFINHYRLFLINFH